MREFHTEDSVVEVKPGRGATVRVVLEIEAEVPQEAEDEPEKTQDDHPKKHKSRAPCAPEPDFAKRVRVQMTRRLFFVKAPPRAKQLAHFPADFSRATITYRKR